MNSGTSISRVLLCFCTKNYKRRSSPAAFLLSLICRRRGCFRSQKWIRLALHNLFRRSITSWWTWCFQNVILKSMISTCFTSKGIIFMKIICGLLLQHSFTWLSIETNNSKHLEANCRVVWVIWAQVSHQLQVVFPDSPFEVFKSYIFFSFIIALEFIENLFHCSLVKDSTCLLRLCWLIRNVGHFIIYFK